MVKCRQCKRKVAEGGLRVTREGVSGWLCGSERCSREYERDGAPTVRRRVAEVVGGYPLVEKADVAKTPKRIRYVPTPGEVARVLKLRASGLVYHRIATEMGWTKEDPRGTRAYKIVKDRERGKR